MSTSSRVARTVGEGPEPHSALGLLALPRHWRWPAEPASVPPARRAVADEVPGLLGPAWPYGPRPGPPTAEARRELADVFSLMASELATNAISHAPTCERIIEVALWRADGMLWLAVSDCGEVFAMPQARATGPLPPALPAADREHGRGLYLVAALADVWTVVPRPDAGKSVVAGVRLA